MNVPFRDLLPMVHPNDIVFDGMKSCKKKKKAYSLSETQKEKCLHVDHGEYI